ncbi:MAG: glycosyltransferase [Lachnospiraceae bacterium]|nr:glycosyltransferase [Lachnospiraceae bacterium]
MKLSLIITTFNSEENLPKTLKALEMQDYPDIEVVIKDGGSTDSTLDIIKDYENTSKYEVKWKTCPDTGIYDAMNQGVQMCTGDVIACYNDEYVLKDAVSSMMKLLEDHPECVGAHADLVYATPTEVKRYWHMGEQKSLFAGWMPGHPTLFLRREIYDKYGLYKTDYRISADYEFMIRFLSDKEAKNKLVYLPKIIISMYYGGTSTDSTGSYIRSLKEGHRALVTNHVHPAFVADCMRTLRVLLQFSSKCPESFIWPLKSDSI